LAFSLDIALVRALEVATAAGDLGAIVRIVEELRALRLEQAGAGVADLDLERERRRGR